MVSGLGVLMLGIGLGFRVQGLGFRVQGLGFRVQGSGFRVQGDGSYHGSGHGFPLFFLVKLISRQDIWGMRVDNLDARGAGV